jgi:phosphinothricin acetyltransferase
MQIRSAESGDAEAIRAIYNAEVTGGVNTFDLVPRTAEEQLAWLEAHAGAHPAVVAVDPAGAPGRPGARGEAVLGFGCLSPYRDRPAYATTVEDSVYVDPEHRGRGVGRALLEDLLIRAAAHGFHAVIARIVGDNQVSVGLHRACGFDPVGVEREVGRKHRRWLDVVELQRLL